jgi:hypothetical protein
VSAQPGARWLRIALAIAAAVVAVLVLVALVGDGGAAQGRSATSADAEVAAHAAPEVVLASSDAPQVAELAPAAPSDEPRHAAAVGESGALRWGDVLRPVDALSGVALTDVRVAHAPVALADKDKGPTWRTLDQPLDANDFAAPGFVVVDVPAHVPALVELAAALAGDQPALVPLSPSAAVRFEIVAEGAGTGVDQIVYVSLSGDWLATSDWSPLQQLKQLGRIDLEVITRRDEPDGSVNVDARDIWDFARWYASDLERIRQDPKRSERWRELTTRRRNQATDSDPPPTSGFYDEDTPASTSFAGDRSATWTPHLSAGFHKDVRASELITGMPAGIELTLDLRAPKHVEFDPAEDDVLFAASPAPIVLEPGEMRVITVRLLGSADVLGALPGGATDGVVELMWRSADGTWVGCESRRELSGGEFRFDDVRPGAWQAAITWRDSSGAHVRVARAFEVVAGETYDLGLLAPNDGVDVTIVPRVEIDGVIDETLLGGALFETSWRFDHTGFEATARELDSATANVLEPLVLRGVLGGEFFIAFDRPELPEAAAANLRFVEWRCPTRHALAGPLTIEATLCLATSLRVPLEFVAKGGSRSSFLRVNALARRVDGDRDDVRTIEVPTAFVLDPSRELRGASASLDPGTWEIFASLGTQTPFENGDEAVTWFGSTRVVVVPGATARIELAPAATVVFGPNFDWRGAEPAGWFQVVPVDAPDALAPLAYPWPGDGITHDAAVDGLAPDTEYRVLGTKIRFRTGASGSRTVLE